MTVLAVVPARGGSRRLPGKNLRTVAGHSLVAWAVVAARASALVGEVVVSSEDPAILHEGNRYGARALLRPVELATDTATTDAVLVHAARVMEWRHDFIVCLQPTVPARRPGLIDQCLRHALTTKADSVFTATRLHFVWKLRTRHEGIRGPWVQANARGRRVMSQAFESIDTRWHEDGAVYVTRREWLQDMRTRIGGKIEVVENSGTVDIDEESDLDIAEALQKIVLDKYGPDFHYLDPK